MSESMRRQFRNKASFEVTTVRISPSGKQQKSCLMSRTVSSKSGRGRVFVALWASVRFIKGKRAHSEWFLSFS